METEDEKNEKKKKSGQRGLRQGTPFLFCTNKLADFEGNKRQRGEKMKTSLQTDRIKCSGISN